MKRFLLLISTLFLLLSPEVRAQKSVSVTGQVVGDDGLPVVAAAVMVAGTSNGVTTDAEGKYVIKGVKMDDVLIFNSLGYVEQRVKYDGNKNINIVLKTDSQMINETVVIGYGTAAKSDLTGSVGVVEMDKVISPIAVSADQALQGRIAGVDIMSNGGEPGGGSSIRIRGTRSISAGNDPLIVVDGIMDAVESFSDINPDDIKNVTVLKDASSTAIYGSRGSNGVILVTTKGQENTKLQMSFSANVGLSELPTKLDVMNATEFAEYRNMYRAINRYYKNGEYDPEANRIFADPQKYGTGTDWQDLLTRKGITQGYKFAVNSGNSKGHAYFSFGYDDVKGILIGSDMHKYTSMLKVDKKFFKWLTAGVRITFAYRNNDFSKVKMNGTTTSPACLSPLVGKNDFWNKYAEEGASGAAVFNSPYIVSQKETNYANVMYLNLAPWVEATLAKGLKLKSTFSYSFNDQDTFFHSPASLPVATYSKTGGTASFNDFVRNTFLSETTLTWNKTIKKVHKINVMGGFTGQLTNTDRHYMKGVGYLDDNVGPYNMAAVMDKRNLNVTSSMTELKRMSVLGRLNYSYKSRYFVTFTARTDGSSNFAAGHKWAFFPAGAFKWTISNESWMQMAKGQWLSNLALRLSAGRSGNDSVATYVSQAALTNGVSTWLFGDSQQLSYAPSRLDNRSLTWEKTDSYNIGVDMSILRGRIEMTADAYLSNTTDLLLKVKNAAQTGYTERYDNIGSTRGWGAEFSITTHNISKKIFDWETTLNLSHSTSIVTELGAGYENVSVYNVGGQMAFGYVKGYPANAIWGYQYCGVWHNDQERADNKLTNTYKSYQDYNGYAKYADVNNDGVLDRNDLVYLGTTDPIIAGGLNNNFRIGKLSLGVYFTYSLGGKVYNLTELYLGTSITTSNKYRYMAQSWTPANAESDIPSAESKDNYGSSRFVHDASYLRLKTVSLSYAFDLSKKVKWLRDITLSAYGENLWLLSKYNGYDPDVTSSGAVRRLDNAAYPNPRTYMLSIKFRY